MSDWNADVAADVTRALPPGKAREVLHSHQTRYGNSILIRTPRYQTWLHKNDPHRRTALPVSVGAFLDRRREYHAIVAGLLDFIGLYEVGKALFSELDATPNVVTVSPYGLDHADVNATAGAVDGVAGTRAGVPVNPRHPEGRRGSGEGSDSIVHLSPNQWDEGGRQGPASRPDEVLFHELVHASRQMRGLSYRTLVSQGYDNEEEYISVVITNIYLSQKRQMVFRASHHGHAALRDPERFLDNPQGVNLPPMELIERFRHTTPRFYGQIARIPDASVWFNPVRQYERRRKAAMAWHP